MFIIRYMKLNVMLGDYDELAVNNIPVLIKSLNILMYVTKMSH